MAPIRRSRIPEGWTLADHFKRDGTTVTCYTNVLGQKFFTYNDLMRYVNYAKREKLSIYSPGFNASAIDKSNSRAAVSCKPKNMNPPNNEKKENVNMHSTTNPPVVAKQKKQAESAAEKQQLGDNTQSHDQSDERTDSGVMVIMIPLAAEGSEKSNLAENNLISVPVVDAVTRRASGRLGGLQPKPEPDSKTNQVCHVASKPEPRRRASRRLAGLEPEQVTLFDDGNNKKCQKRAPKSSLAM